jgi:hypothetical protein
MNASKKNFFIIAGIFIFIVISLTVDLSLRTNARWNQENEYMYKYVIERKNSKLEIKKDSVKRKK